MGGRYGRLKDVVLGTREEGYDEKFWDLLSIARDYDALPTA